MNNTQARVQVFSPEEFSKNLASEIVEEIKACLLKQDFCRIALAGGGTPAKIYELIVSTASLRDEVEWLSLIHI